ncbi:hypothetical protein HDU97_004508 [Phlyctochytrium planicorne]|nr:hypothetical protein HDU97_004508 [Phlyctochytrium planicorne]
MTDSNWDIWYMTEERKGWFQIPGKCKSIHIFNTNNLAAINQDKDLVIRRLPSGGSGPEDWTPQSVAPVERIGTLPFGNDLWFATPDPDQTIHKWNLKPRDETAESVTSVIDIWIRDRIYVSVNTAICARERFVQDWVCNNLNETIPLYVAASDSLLYFMDQKFRLYYLPLPLLERSRNFVFTGYTASYSRGIGVGLDSSNPLPYVIKSDGTVDETFCFDSSYNCGVATDLIKAMKPIPYTAVITVPANPTSGIPNTSNNTNGIPDKNSGSSFPLSIPVIGGIAAGIILSIGLIVAVTVGVHRGKQKRLSGTSEPSYSSQASSQRGFYKISRSTDLQPIPLRTIPSRAFTSQTSSERPTRSAFPPLPYNSTDSSLSLSAVSRTDSLSSVSTLHRAYHPEDSTIVRPPEAIRDEARQLKPGGSMFESQHAFRVLSEMKANDPIVSLRRQNPVNVLPKAKDMYASTLVEELEMPRPILPSEPILVVHEDSRHDDVEVVEAPPVYRPTPMLYRELAERQHAERQDTSSGSGAVRGQVGKSQPPPESPQQRKQLERKWDEKEPAGFEVVEREDDEVDEVVVFEDDDQEWDSRKL